MTVTWTILIPTLGQRAVLFQRLLDVLLPQLDPYGGAVRVLGYWNNGQPPLPTVRQQLVEAVDADYLSFIDDDDLVPEYHVAEVVAALTARPDMVGWQTQFYIDGKPSALVDHSLRHGRWYRDRDGIYRDITHINPVRVDLAKKCDFRRAGRGKAEDRVWVAQMRPRVKTEAYIDKVMYHYLWSAATTAWQKPDRIAQGPFERPVVDSPHFAWHPGSADA